MWIRLRQIALVARQLEPVVEDLCAVLGVEVCYRDPEVAHFGLENALFPIGNQFLEVVAPVREGTTAGRFLERRGGDGGYMVINQCDEHAPFRRRVEELGVRVVYEHDDAAYRLMQLHPKDTGGSFLEIDEQRGEGAHDADGPWFPAGGSGWQAFRRVDVVSAITAAEVQVDDPDKTAARWAEIMDLPVARDDLDRPVVRLDNADVRFVPVTDGRGEGLGGIDLRVADRARLLEAAEARGRRRGDDVVELVGMRMHLV